MNMLAVAVSVAQEAGAYLMRNRSNIGRAVAKGDQFNVVTEADIGAERLILDGLHRAFPNHSTIAEESGVKLHPESPYTWVVDPLDGTSNYAAGLPWYGVLIALMRDATPELGVMYLPESSELFVAERGRGAFLNGQRIRVTEETELSNVLWAYGMDAPDELHEQRDGRLLFDVLRSVRNLRTTNSLVDSAFTCTGRLGGMLNRSTRLWDIAAPSLVVQESGGLYTTITGDLLSFDLTETAHDKEYAVLAGAPALHRQVAKLVRKHL
ncbi:MULTISPECIES: inositol monophosphatase family protein [Xanthomonas]|uniref:inositol monophosphatase family protein n=1 Tax=Xanthomonas TaxID=338 RepID=UPI001E64C0B3|nr:MULTISPECIES: inositol monophosphatase family protein [Xanthomonas]MCC5065802.1 inositol monophosphatase [Xanthomonas campestris pv. raphani]MCC8485141.1 inositol monophosphatase [Xanthomonas campestris]MDV2452750.1 inositol monophosphatase family protein [Xanthomonas hortorum NBC5720]MEA9652326.1 inositol monophosphatase family protein [Xanthomonas campestris pv. raphani]MEA9740853.1 inositol monophosphatase family protein [Xanthomonas campestris pv. raphani]